MNPTSTLTFNALHKANLLPFIVLTLSLLSLSIKPAGFNNPAFYISMAGLLGVALFVLNIGFSRTLFYLWVIAQLVVIRYGETATAADLAQGVNVPLYLPVKLGSAGYQVGLNMVAVFLIGLIVLTRPKALIGSDLTFTAYRHNNALGSLFPLKGRAERFVNLSGEKNWVLVRLSAPITYNNKYICYVLVMRNDKQPIIKNCINQLVFFKLVEEVNSITDGCNLKTDFKDEVWALCK